MLTFVPKENILIDDDEVAVLCDAKFDSLMYSEDDYGSIRSNCWWLPYERLIADDVTDDKCCLGPPSMPADIYGAALTITQVRIGIL